MRPRKLRMMAVSLLLAALLLTAVPACAAVQTAVQAGMGAASDQSAPLNASPRSSPVFTLRSSSSHEKYMGGDPSGLFLPSKALTRAELAQMLYGVVEQRPEETPSFTDVPETSWYAPAVGAMAGLGILSGGDDGAFRPNDPVTRAECAVALAQLIPDYSYQKVSFADVPEDHWAYEEISHVVSYGLFQGDDRGYFSPEAELRRAEAATLFNRLLGRTPGDGMTARIGSLSLFPDVPPSHWAYDQIMEAAVDHEVETGTGGQEVWTSVSGDVTVLEDGFHRIGGRLYCVRDGAFLRGTTDGVFTYDEHGRYTTGDTDLDKTLNAIIEEQTDESMTRDEKLRALYVYIRDSYTYLKRPLITAGQTGWEPEYASFFLTNGKGNCYCFSAAYCLLARNLGLPAYTVVGSLGRNYQAHGWVEIELDGAVYMFDTQLEWRYLHDYGRTGYNLFKMLPSEAPFTYHW